MPCPRVLPEVLQRLLGRAVGTVGAEGAGAAGAELCVDPLETRGSASSRGAAGPVTPSASVWWTVRSRAVDRGGPA